MAFLFCALLIELSEVLATLVGAGEGDGVGSGFSGVLMPIP